MNISYFDTDLVSQMKLSESGAMKEPRNPDPRPRPQVLSPKIEHFSVLFHFSLFNFPMLCSAHQLKIAAVHPANIYTHLYQLEVFFSREEIC